MVTMYHIRYTSADGCLETLTIYSHGDNYGAGVNYCTSDPELPNAQSPSDRRQLASAERFDEADRFAQRITDLLTALVPNATLEVDQGDALSV